MSETAYFMNRAQAEMLENTPMEELLAYCKEYGYLEEEEV
jgi:hypothetical protein